MKKTILITTAVLCLIAMSANAQLEPGWGVYARLHYPVNATAAAIPGGLVLYHPYLGKNAVITGLPDTLTWKGRTGFGGANAVLVRDADGSLLVANAYHEQPAIFHIALKGTAATVLRTYTIGTTPAPSQTASIDQMAWLPENRVLFTHIGVKHANLVQPTGLAILDLKSGAVTPVQITNFPTGRYINACTVDPTFTTVYIGTYGNGGGLYAVPLAGGPAVAVPNHATMPSAVQQLAMGYDGELYLAPGWGIGKVLRIDPATGASAEVANVVGTVNALCLEPVTGDLLFMRIAPATTPPIPEGNSAAYYWRNPTEGMVLTPGMNGYESPAGVAVRSSLLPFGRPHPRSPQQWRIHPNPGGAPRVGNLGFTLTTDSECKDRGFMLLGLRPLQTPITTCLMSNLLLNPCALCGFIPLMRPARSFTVRIPLCAKMGTGDLYAQMISIRKGGWSSHVGGQGLRVHIYE